MSSPLPHPPIAIVTGAPGAGKSSVARVMAAQPTDFLVFDADRLLEAAAVLAGREIAAEEALWPPYRTLWLTFLNLVAENGRQAVVFMPLAPHELPPQWQESVRWCLLDCNDATRTRRLQARWWTVAAIGEVIEDAVALRRQIVDVIDTSRQESESVAAVLTNWLARLSA